MPSTIRTAHGFAAGQHPGCCTQNQYFPRHDQSFTFQAVILHSVDYNSVPREFCTRITLLHTPKQISMIRMRAIGFTLLEFLMVFTIIAIMAAFAASRMASSGDYNVSPIVEQLERNIRYTQLLSMSLNQNFTITITATGYAISPAPPEGAVSVTMPEGVTLTPAVIMFNASGDPGIGTNLNLTVSGPSFTRTLTVNRETGYVDG